MLVMKIFLFFVLLFFLLNSFDYVACSEFKLSECGSKNVKSQKEKRKSAKEKEEQCIMRLSF